MMRTLILFESNLRLLPLATTRTMSGARVTALLPSFVPTPFGFWFQWQSTSIVPFVRVIAKTHFAKAFFLPTRSLLFDLPRVIPRLSQMNIGFFSRLCTASAAALDIGTRNSIKFSFPLVLPLLLKIRAYSQVLFTVPTIPAVVFMISLSPLASMLMTLFTSQRIPRLRNYFAGFSVSAAKCILWGLLSGFLVFTSRGTSPHPWSPFT